MLKRTTLSMVAALFAMGTLADEQAEHAEVTEHEEVTEATLLEVDTEKRHITVMLPDGSTNEYMVAEDADITTWDGVREREHDIHALTPGVELELELELDGEDMTVRSLSSRSES